MSEQPLENQGVDAKHIYEPLKEYANRFKDDHIKHSEQFFDELATTSKIDVPANRETVKQIKKLTLEKDNFKKEHRKKASLKGFLIFLIVISIAALPVGLLLAMQYGLELYHYFMMIGGPLLSIVWIILLVKKVNPIVKALKGKITELETKIKQQTDIAYDQMRPLNDSFYDGMSRALFKKTIPLINLDIMFDSKRLDYLVSKFKYEADLSKQRSTLYIQSGDISGNPFFVGRDLIHTMGTATYSGSITINWTSREYVNGKWVTRYHSQVLTATVTKPCPYYSEHPYVIYGNEVAPLLSFHREDSDAETMSDKQLERHVDRNIKKMHRMERKALKQGKTYTTLGNEEFEVLFNAPNRDNEAQFRLLFTPLAQRQLLALMKDKIHGFGDDFDFIKSRMINKIIPHHLLGINLEASPSMFVGYDHDDMRKRFIDYNSSYFRHMYFALAPILSIPLYQQHKPHEYIYKDTYSSYVSFYEHEHVANKMNESSFKHPLSSTRNILKTSIVSSGENRDTVKVTAYGYKTVERIDHVAKFGGDGRTHSVPVHWIEYIPVDKETLVDIDVIPETEEKSAADKVRDLILNLKQGQADTRTLFALGALVAHIHKK